MAEGTDNKSNPPADKGGKRTFAAPTGTRDLYPLELARRRWIEDKWRKTAVRHGFDEIDGPTFEHTELYTAKSGDGIVGEIFSTFSGKDPQAVQQMGQRLAAGDRGAIAPYALRPEFTPTLARMFAARGGQFPKPCKWFWQGPCYRAEKPQRGRLREFWQWNVDILGGDDEFLMDVECMSTLADLLQTSGLQPGETIISVGNRKVLSALLNLLDVPEELHSRVFVIADKLHKIPYQMLHREFENAGLSSVTAAELGTVLQKSVSFEQSWDFVFKTLVPSHLLRSVTDRELFEPLHRLHESAASSGISSWLRFDWGVVRGLAYYTGTVFEALHGSERAVAGGGRYDNLIETFGGPPTPAVGFGMGDVVLSLVLQDKGLMPSDKQIAADLGLRPDVFVISNGQPESDALVGKYLADLRRKGMHARRSYKTTKNVGKLLQDAAGCNARYAVIIESATDITLKDMDGSTQDKGPAAELLARITPPAV